MKGFSVLTVLYVITAGILFPGCSSSNSIQLEQNKALVREMISLPMAEYRPRIKEFLSPEYVGHAPWEANPLNRDDIEKLLKQVNTGFPDLHNTIEDMVAEGDKVVTRYTMHGTHKGNFMGTPATGKEVTVTGITISRIKDGKIVEEWEEDDILGLASKIGVISFKK